MATGAWPKYYKYERGRLICMVVVNLDKHGEPTATCKITEKK